MIVTCQLIVAFGLNVPSMVLIKILEFVHKVYGGLHRLGNLDCLSALSIDQAGVTLYVIILMTDLNYRTDLNVKKH